VNALVAILAVVASVSAAPPPAAEPHGQAVPAASPPHHGDAGPVNTGAIGRLIAAARDGDTVEIGPGIYQEHIRIDRSIRLVGKGSPVIDGGGRGDIIEIVAPDVVLRGFSIRGTGIDLERENAAVRATAARVVIEDNTIEDVLFGIDLRESPGSIVRGNRIGGKRLDVARRGDGLRLWRCDGALIENNIVHDGRDSILWYSKGITVRGNTGRDCRYGLHLMFSDGVTIENNLFTSNSVGIYLMYTSGVSISGNTLYRNRGPSGYGIGLKETDRFTVTQNRISANRVGVYIDGSPFTAAQPGDFHRNTIAYNDIGFTFLPSARNNELYENNFIDNINQVSVAGRGSLGANRFWKGERGNYWSDYTGYDHDGDGIGDFVHESWTLFENMMDREPKLRLFLFSPAQQAIEFVGRALPSVRPEPMFVDEVPLMRPVELPADAHASPASPVSLGAFAAVLLLCGGAVAGVAGGRFGGKK